MVQQWSPSCGFCIIWAPPGPPGSRPLQEGPCVCAFTSPAGDSDTHSSLRATALRHNSLSLHQCPGIFLVTDIKYDSCKILAAEYICLFNCMQNTCQDGFQGLFCIPLSCIYSTCAFGDCLSPIHTPKVQSVLKAPHSHPFHLKLANETEERTPHLVFCIKQERLTDFITFVTRSKTPSGRK